MLAEGMSGPAQLHYLSRQMSPFQMNGGLPFSAKVLYRTRPGKVDSQGHSDPLPTRTKDCRIVVAPRHTGGLTPAMQADGLGAYDGS